MKKRDLESLRQQHKAKFTGGKSASAKKDQREPQISPDIDETKEESGQLLTGNQKSETKNNWKQGEFVEKRRRNFKWVWRSGAILLLILVLISIFRYVSSNKGSQERNTYQSSWSSSEESGSDSFSETSSRSWEVPEDETSQEATAYVDKKAANFTWTFDDILALQVYSSEQQGSGQDAPTAQAGGPALGHAIGAGAVGVAGGITTAAGLGGQHGLGAVGPCPAPVHDPCIGQDARQQRHRLVQYDVDCVFINASHAAHAGQHGAQRAPGAFQALQRELHVFGRERAAVMKAHALAQMEAPDDRGEQFPALGQRRFDLQPGRVAGQ